jgi:hypothetical protein
METILLPGKQVCGAVEVIIGQPHLPFAMDPATGVSTDGVRGDYSSLVQLNRSKSASI